MKRLLIILFASLAFAGGAWGDTGHTNITALINACTNSNGAGASCDHFCDEHSALNPPYCSATPPGGPLFDDVIVNVDCSDAGTGPNGTPAEGCNIDQSTNFIDNSVNPIVDFNPELDVDNSSVLDNAILGNTLDLSSDDNSVLDSAILGNSLDLSSDDDSNDQSMDSSGNSANFNTDLSTQTITDGANTMTTGAITDGNVTVSGADINCHPHNNSEDASTGDIRCGENVNENAMSNDGSGNSTNENKMAASGNSDNANDVMIDQSDHSTTSSTSVYQEAFRAPTLATQLNVTTSHCINFLGIQMTGADKSGAGGIGLGIPMRDSECRLEKAAILAFQMENYEAGWTAYCNQKSVRAAWVARAKSEDVERRGRKNFAVKQCMQTGVDTQQTLQNIHDELELLRTELVTVEGMPGYDDTAIHNRIKVLEDAAHLPNKSFLLNR